MYIKLSEKEKEKRKQERKKTKAIKKYQEKISSEKNQKSVKEITINIEYKKSRQWGTNPCASARIEHKDGTFSCIDGITASGCGYDKESTVIAEIFNRTLKYRLWKKSESELKSCPYGISKHKYLNEFNIEVENRYFEGGIGTNCYNSISEFIDGRFENIASGKSFDVFKFTDK